MDPLRIEDHSSEHGSIKSYVLGYLLSLAFTLISYFAVAEKIASPMILLSIIGVSALFQTVVQLVLFLHLGAESKPRWQMMTFFFMVIVVGAIVLGSIWIMENLNYRTM